MARLMSCSLTTGQVCDYSKLETRRLGWESAKVGDEIQLVGKSMGRKQKDGSVIPINRLAMVKLVEIRTEPLNVITTAGCHREGFPEKSPSEFVDMFCSHLKTKPDTIVRVLRWHYLDGDRELHIRVGLQRMKTELDRYCGDRIIAHVHPIHIAATTAAVWCRHRTTGGRLFRYPKLPMGVTSLWHRLIRESRLSMANAELDDLLMLARSISNRISEFLETEVERFMEEHPLSPGDTGSMLGVQR